MSTDSNFKHPLDELFDTVETTPLGVQKPDLPVPAQTTALATKTDDEQEKQFQSDFEDSRTKIQSAMDVVDSSMNELLMISQSAQDPKGFKVVAELANAQAALSRTLMEIHKARRGGNTDTPPPQPQGGNGPTPIAVEQAVFVGSTADLLAMRNAERKE